MKAIILAGGLGTRLGKYTKNLPKAMLNFEGKPLIQRQVETYRKLGIEDIIIVRKHLADKINISGVKFIDETDYETHMVVGLFEARNEFNDNLILSYGDLLFEQKVLEDTINSHFDVCVVVDTDWKDYWIARYGSYLEDSESMILDEKGRIISLGIPNPKPEDMHARYVGIIKFSKKILQEIEKVYDKSKKEFWDKPWYTSPSFKRAYMTDFIQSLIDNNLNVNAIKIRRGWFEFDTVKDYEQALTWIKEGSLNRFYNLE